MTFNFKGTTKRVYNKSRSHYLELHTKLELIYVIQVNGNKLIEIYSIEELKNHIKDFKNNV